MHRELERELADFYGSDACLIFVSGHATNISTIGMLMSPEDLIVQDELMHNSAIVGAKLSRGPPSISATTTPTTWRRCCGRTARSTRTR